MYEEGSEGSTNKDIEREPIAITSAAQPYADPLEESSTTRGCPFGAKDAHLCRCEGSGLCRLASQIQHEIQKQQLSSEERRRLFGKRAEWGNPS
jgi:hypothetical protein